jgi:hypothetical protein
MNTELFIEHNPPPLNTYCQNHKNHSPAAALWRYKFFAYCPMERYCRPSLSVTAAIDPHTQNIYLARFSKDSRVVDRVAIYPVSTLDLQMDDARFLSVPYFGSFSVSLRVPRGGGGGKHPNVRV